jgi:hypothetical protein
LRPLHGRWLRRARILSIFSGWRQIGLRRISTRILHRCLIWSFVAAYRPKAKQQRKNCK